MVTSVIQGPGHNFASEDLTIFLEDANITTGERVARPRQYPQVLLPSAPTLGAGQVSNLSMQDIQRLHQTTSEILARAGQQQPQPSLFSHPVSSSSVPSLSLDIPPLENDTKNCPVCLKEFREFAKCKSHYDTQHIRQSLYTCKKCKKALCSKANLQHHLELFHKHFNFVCIICQYSAQRKADISKHMRQWLDHPELRCRHCVQVLHNKDGLHQHLKVSRHNTDRNVSEFMCRNPGFGSVFSLAKKRNYHEKHRCHLLKKNIGRGRGQPQ